ncbi:MAG: hypothetical protein MJE68_28910 [Proteobacteria bacterium]|nr:hypothetical protein [Pseudomonadota bacterium]
MMISKFYIEKSSGIHSRIASDGRITSQVVQSCFSDEEEEPIQALAESLPLKNTPSVSEKIFAIQRTRPVSQDLVMTKACSGQSFKVHMDNER